MLNKYIYLCICFLFPAVLLGSEYQNSHSVHGLIQCTVCASMYIAINVFIGFIDIGCSCKISCIRQNGNSTDCGLSVCAIEAINALYYAKIKAI